VGADLDPKTDIVIHVVKPLQPDLESRRNAKGCAIHITLFRSIAKVPLTGMLLFLILFSLDM